MSNESSQHSAPQPAPRAGTGRWVVVLLGSGFLAFIGVLGIAVKATSYGLAGFEPPEMAAARYSSKDVIGDLGGMKVLVPRAVAMYVEYDDDPGFGEKRKEPRPQRTYESKLRSFGFEVRYPNMDTLTTAEMWKDKQSHSIYTTHWMLVGIVSGQHYSRDGFVHRLAYAKVMEKRPRYWWEDYERLPDPQFGLAVYALKGTDLTTGRPARESRHEHDVFVFFDMQGKAQTYIRCSNVTHAEAPCSHKFSMEHEGVHAEITVHYRRDMLPHWQEIQTKVKQVVMGFKA